MDKIGTVPRVATVLFAASAGMSDQALAERLAEVLRDAMAADDSLAIDPESIEVHVSTISDEHDAWMRRVVFGADR